MLIKRQFYNRNTIKVAQDLLGYFLVRKSGRKIISAKIIETEAYRGEYDLASHASRGKTKRTEIMYGAPGHAYVYMIYGMYFMLNIVTEGKDFPAAVLIRGIEDDKGRKIEGPGKLTKFLKINKSLNDWDLTRGEKLWLEYPLGHPMSKLNKVVKSPRVGIDYARHSKNWKWNFKLSE